MNIQAVGINSFANSGFSTPVQSLGMIAVTAVALHAISNLQIAQAKTAAEGACEKICEPLPGSKADMPERICTKTCVEGAEIIETKTKESMQNGSWKIVSVLGQTAGNAFAYMFCSSTICNPLAAVAAEAGQLARSAAYFMGGQRTAALKDAISSVSLAACTALTFIPTVGYGSCMTCCAGLKLADIATI